MYVSIYTEVLSYNILKAGNGNRNCLVVGVRDGQGDVLDAGLLGCCGCLTVELRNGQR
jgi:hypothetical protein